MMFVHILKIDAEKLDCYPIVSFGMDIQHIHDIQPPLILKMINQYALLSQHLINTVKSFSKLEDADKSLKFHLR